MNKKILFFLIILTLITGCNDKKKESNNYEEQKEQIKEEITNDDKEESEALKETDKPINNETNKNNSTTSNKNNNVTNNNTVSTPKPSNTPTPKPSSTPTPVPTPMPTPEPTPSPTPSLSPSQNTVIRIDATKEYYCIGNFQLIGTKCVSKISVDALSKYVCDEGELQGTSCIISGKTVVYVNQYAGYYEACYSKGLRDYNLYQCACSSQGGYTQKISDTEYKCYKNGTTTKNARLEYYCTSGTTLVGNKCEKEYSTDAPFKLTCPNGYKLNGIYCEK